MSGSDACLLTVQTYGLQIFDQPLYEELMYNWTRPGGCRDKAKACEAALKERDSDPSYSKNITEICGTLSLECDENGPITHYHTKNVRVWTCSQ